MKLAASGSARSCRRNDSAACLRALKCTRLPFQCRVAGQFCRHSARMPRSIYEPLHERLRTENGPSLRLTFSEIESILGKPLPRSAYTFTAWWSTLNRPGPQAKAWMSAGYRVRVSMKHRIVEFYRSDVDTNGRHRTPWLH